ncbi:Ultraviolet-B receptor UVR8-like [Oopsacas minuta]|uniref:Ultraviolet-B receptor UVR8-like n=1 Tax=Oopsacas minuta TaxID=111878 RepID=A0AAV7K620_9METZ|nr:Ultraviolet-B receptor UVR8-like [Oopsacas minuta]
MAVSNPDKNGDKVKIRGIWTWGSDGYGRLGQGTINKHLLTPQKVLGLEGKVITSIACGSAHTIITCYKTDDGKEGEIGCYSWGKCHFGMLGHNELEIDQSIPLQLTVLGDIKEKVRSVGCGQSFSFLVTEGGGTYSWGCGYYGALGHGNETSLLTPKRIEGLKGEKVKSIRGGAFHSIALTEDGKVFSWGRDHMGQLGLAPLSGTSKVRLNHKTPEQVILPSTATKISTFCNHSMILMEDQILLSFGDNTHEQLGHKMPSYDANKDLKKGKEECRVMILSEKELETYIPILDMACGTSHSLAVTTCNKLYSWGNNSNGALGRNDLDKEPKQVKVGDVKFVGVSAGHEFSLALSIDKKVYSWGENYLSKLGRENKTEFPEEVKGLENIDEIICAENHCTALEF